MKRQTCVGGGEGLVGDTTFKRRRNKREFNNSEEFQEVPVLPSGTESLETGKGNGK